MKTTCCLFAFAFIGVSVGAVMAPSFWLLLAVVSAGLFGVLAACVVFHCARNAR